MLGVATSPPSIVVRELQSGKSLSRYLQLTSSGIRFVILSAGYQQFRQRSASGGTRPCELVSVVALADEQR